MQRRPGEPARFGVEVNSPTLELLATVGPRPARADLPRRRAQLAARSGNERKQWCSHGRLPRVLRDQEPPPRTGSDRVQADLLGHPPAAQPRRSAEGIHHAARAPARASPSPTCTSTPTKRPGRSSAYSNETPVAASGCDELAFDPSLSLAAEDTGTDEPDGITADLHVPQLTDEPSKPNSPDVQGAQVTLPEGLTLDPSAANGLLACSNAQYAEGNCPEASNVGSVLVECPRHPRRLLGRRLVRRLAGSRGRAGIGRRVPHVPDRRRPPIRGRAAPRRAGHCKRPDGAFDRHLRGAPQVPFEDFLIHLRGGARAPLANPLACGAVTPSAEILPYTGQSATAAAASGFSVSGCAPTLPFSLQQALTPENPRAGAFSPFTFDLARGGHPAVPLPRHRHAAAGPRGRDSRACRCAPTHRPTRGRARPPVRSAPSAVAAGAGSEPYALTGRAYLTGPYGGAPYGLSVVVPAVAGPYDLGEVVTRAAISVGLYNGRVTRHQHAAERRRRRAAAPQEHQRERQPAAVRVESDELRAAGHRIAVGLHARRPGCPLEPVPGGQLRCAGIQAASCA